MKKDTEKTPVKILYHEELKDLFAFFPGIRESKNECGDTLFLAYSQTGQHSSACAEYAAEARRATDEEAKELIDELTQLGYNLEII
jgi:hypothetical protein